MSDEIVRLAIMLASLALACGPSEGDWPLGRPKIDRLEFTQQSPQDPYALEFSISFSDSDGDSGTGQLHLTLDGAEISVLPMSMLFGSQSPPLALESIEGTFEVVARVSADAEIGEELTFGFIIEDASGERSNDPWVQLKPIAEGS